MQLRMDIFLRLENYYTLVSMKFVVVVSESHLKFNCAGYLKNRAHWDDWFNGDKLAFDVNELVQTANELEWAAAAQKRRREEAKQREEDTKIVSIQYFWLLAIVLIKFSFDIHMPASGRMKWENGSDGCKTPVAKDHWKWEIHYTFCALLKPPHNSHSGVFPFILWALARIFNTVRSFVSAAQI